MNPLAVDHVTDIVQGDQIETGVRFYRAECSCGWSSTWTDDPTDADDARWDHNEVVA